MRRRNGTRVLAAVLFTDIVKSTEVASRLGDARWKELIARHHALVRRELKRFGGREFDTAGDGFFAGFKEPAAAIRCACATAEGVRQLGIEIRAGVHFGECEQSGSKLGGIAVVVGARVMSLGGAGEVLITATTRDLVAGAGFAFVDRGAHTLKGVEGQWHVLAVSEVDGTARPEPADQLEAAERLAEVQPSAVLSRGWLASHRWRVALGFVVVLALIAAALPSLRSGSGSIDAGTNSIARLDGQDGSLERVTALGQRPGASVIGLGSLWVVEPDQGVVARLNLDNGSIIDKIPVGASPAGIAVDDGSVWVTNAGDGTLSRIDAETGAVSDPIRVGTGPSGIAVGDDGVLWVTDPIRGELLRVDPVSGAVEPVPLAGQPSGVTVASDGVWVTYAPAGVARVGLEDASVTLTQSVGNDPTAVLQAFDSIWVANALDGTVSRLEPSSGSVETSIPVGEGPSALVAAEGSVWVANELDGSISAIDPSTDTADRTVPVSGAAVSLAADSEGLWLAVGPSATQHRGGKLNVSSEGAAPTSLDPAINYDDAGWSILSVTNDGLLAYKKVGGADGATLVPDLAAALPEVSDKGRTYRFPLRGGVEYSTGEPVRPEDFRYGIERAISLSKDAEFALKALDGAQACNAHPSQCDLSESIVVDAESVTFHLARLDADFPFKLAMPFAVPVPASVPIEDQGMAPFPATGPYMIEMADSDHIELARNTAFHEWNAAAQPDGFVNEISWSFNDDVASSFQRLRAGEVDWMTDPPGPHDLASLMAEHPDQVVFGSPRSTLFIGVDTNKEPFDDPRVRQAMNYGIDRGHVADLLGGPTSESPTCQILPPTFQGYEPFCPYTLEPDSGVWTAPDLDRAQALIKAAGAVRTKVTVWETDDPDAPLATPAKRLRTMTYVVGMLNDIGLHARLKTIPDIDVYAQRIYAGELPVFLFGWVSDYPRAGDFITSQFACGSDLNVTGFCEPKLDAAMLRALRLQGIDPAGANLAWTDIEHRLIEAAIWTPVTNIVSASSFSARTENIQVNPQLGILLSRLWVQ